MDNESPLRVLLIGKGGRESALAVKLSQSPRVEKIFVVPGNGGTARGIDKVSNINHINDEDFDGLVKLANELRINLVVPGTSSRSLCLLTSESSFVLSYKQMVNSIRTGCPNCEWNLRVLSCR